MEGLDIEDERIYRISVYEKYYNLMSNKYVKKLTITDIVMAFPEEIKTIVPRVMNRLEKELKFYEQQASYFKAQAIESYGREGIKTVMEDIMPKEKINKLQSLKQLKSMLDVDSKEVNRFTEAQIEQARKVDIRRLYNFNKSRAYGNRYVACCPFHKGGEEKTPSFMIFPRGNYNCFGCGKKGNNAIDFIMELNGIRFNEAVKMLIKV